MSSDTPKRPAERPEQAAEPLRILLADDHQVVRRGLQLILDAEKDFEVVAQAGDIRSVARQVAELQPDVLLLDFNMPGGSVLDAIPQLRAVAPNTRIVVLTMRDEPTLARAVLNAGAGGYVLKEAADSELTMAIHEVVAGRRYLTRRLAGDLLADDILTGGWD
jgi:two-component system response regulator NreC